VSNHATNNEYITPYDSGYRQLACWWQDQADSDRGIYEMIVDLLDALGLGIVLILLAIGLTLVFGFMNIINLSHGGFWMVGGYVGYEVVQMTGNFWVGLVTVAILTAVIGALFEMLLLRASYESGPIVQALITLGGLFAMTGTVLVIWGGTGLTMNPPSIFSGPIQLLGVTYPLYRIVLIGIGSVLITGTWIFLRYTKMGLIIRAAYTDKEMARGLGHNISKIYTVTFTGAVVLAALGGMLTMPTRGVTSNTGFVILLDAFAITMIGGLGSYRGTIVAGLFAGGFITFITRYVSPSLSEFALFTLLLLVLLIKPYGIYGMESGGSH